MTYKWIFFLIFIIQKSVADCPVGTQSLASDAALCMALAINYDVTFTEANTRCFAANGRLSRITNVYDNHLAAQMMRQQDGNMNHTLFSIGITRIDGNWQYADDQYGDIPITYFNWAQDEPSATGDCAYLSRKDSKWYADECTMTRPYFCDVPILNDPLYCTDQLNVDLFFMIDASGSEDDNQMMHEVLWGLNTVLRTQWYSSPLDCTSDTLTKQQTRIAGLVYYDNTWINSEQPRFCIDRFPRIVDNMRSNFSQQHFVSDLSIPFNALKDYTEGDGCACRRNETRYGTRQVVIWVPMRDSYNTSRDLSLSELSTWDHYLWPIMVSQQKAVFPLWRDALMKEIKMPTDHPEFIPTQILTIWRFLCDLTGSSGETPPAPFI